MTSTTGKGEKPSGCAFCFFSLPPSRRGTKSGATNQSLGLGWVRAEHGVKQGDKEQGEGGRSCGATGRGSSHPRAPHLTPVTQQRDGPVWLDSWRGMEPLTRPGASGRSELGKVLPPHHFWLHFIFHRPSGSTPAKGWPAQAQGKDPCLNCVTTCPERSLERKKEQFRRASPVKGLERRNPFSSQLLLRQQFWPGPFPASPLRAMLPNAEAQITFGSLAR